LADRKTCVRSRISPRKSRRKPNVKRLPVCRTQPLARRRKHGLLIASRSPPPGGERSVKGQQFHVNRAGLVSLDIALFTRVMTGW